jgi:abortive infection bacteriophage resistance protein
MAEYTKRATNIDQQIALLQDRGMLIADVKHAKEVLLSVGYYRMGFYWFAFEINKNLRSKRDHKFRKDATWEKAEALYRFDDKFRNIISFYIQIIETDLRTFTTYTVSNFYKDDPYWFANPDVMTKKYMTEELQDMVLSVGRNDVIKRHIEKYSGIFSPAWKTLELLTFGELQKLFENIKDTKLNENIYTRYQVGSEKQFISYLNVLRNVRNVCAHGHILYDKRLHAGIKGNAKKLGLNPKEESNIVDILKLIYYMLRMIDLHHENEMQHSIQELVRSEDYSSVKKLISRIDF